MSEHLQDAFCNGYMAAPEIENPYCSASTSWDGFELGKYFQRTHRGYNLIRKGRGNTYKTTRGEHFRIYYKPFRIEPIDRILHGKEPAQRELL